MPLAPDQADGIDHTSHLYEDKLLRELRIERLKSPRAFSQQPPSAAITCCRCRRSSRPTPRPARWTSCAREFHYTESQGDELNIFVGTCFHHLCSRTAALRMTLKRVNLINCDAALPAMQLFI